MQSSLTLLDGLIILLYFVFIIWLGTRLRRRRKDTERHFLGSRKIPMWAIAISTFATIISTQKAYASSGLVYTFSEGRMIDITYLHIREWLVAIRNGGKTFCEINAAFEDAVTCLMATLSNREKRLVEWDLVNEKVK